MSFSYRNPSFSGSLVLSVWWLINLQLLVFIEYLLQFETALYPTRLCHEALVAWKIPVHQDSCRREWEETKRWLSFWKYLGLCRLPKGSQESASFPEPPWQKHKSHWRSENFMPLECKCSFVHPKICHSMSDARSSAVTKAKGELKQRPTAHQQASWRTLPHQTLSGKAKHCYQTFAHRRCGFLGTQISQPEPC